MVRLIQLELPDRNDLIKPKSVKDAEKEWSKVDNDDYIVESTRKQNNIDALIKNVRSEDNGGKED